MIIVINLNKQLDFMFEFWELLFLSQTQLDMAIYRRWPSKFISGFEINETLLMVILPYIGVFI